MQKCQLSIRSPARSVPAAATTARPSSMVATGPRGLNSTAILVPAAAKISAARRMTVAVDVLRASWKTVRTYSAPTSAAASASCSAWAETTSRSSASCSARSSWQRIPAAASCALVSGAALVAAMPRAPKPAAAVASMSASVERSQRPSGVRASSMPMASGPAPVRPRACTHAVDRHPGELHLHLAGHPNAGDPSSLGVALRCRRRPEPETHRLIRAQAAERLVHIGGDHGSGVRRV